MIVKNKRNKNGKIALFEVMILLVAIFAFAWMVGSVGEVSAAPGDDPPEENPPVETCSGECIDPASCEIPMQGTCLGGQICCGKSFDQSGDDGDNGGDEGGLDIDAKSATKAALEILGLLDRMGIIDAEKYIKSILKKGGETTTTTTTKAGEEIIN